MEPARATDWMIACPVKSATGIDCPGCGFQRAFLDLMGGDLAGAWHHYPPLFPFILTLILLVVALLTRNDWRLRVLKGSFIFTLLSVGMNYAYKMIFLSA